MMRETQQSGDRPWHLRRSEKALIVVLSVGVVSTVGAAMTALMLRLEPDAAALSTTPAAGRVTAGALALPRPGGAVPTFQ